MFNFKQEKCNYIYNNNVDFIDTKKINVLGRWNSKYKAALYKITKYHRIEQNFESGYNEGLEIEVLGFMLYDNFNEKQ